MPDMSASIAIVAVAPGPDYTPGSNFELQDIQVPTELQDGEVLVDMVASGVCHTDLSTSKGNWSKLPFVPGHEGSAIVKAVGPNVSKDVKPGDPVLLSFTHCTACPQCDMGRPAYCDAFVPLNLIGREGVFRGKDGQTSIGGLIFGQSSFAKLSIVKDTSILPVRDLIKSEEELKLFAPLGCGIQTGAGAVLNLVKPNKHDRVLVTGLGGVGLSAVMAARIAGCQQIIAVDRIQERIDLAREVFGATDGINTTRVTDLTAAMKEVGGGRGPSVVIETTGYPPIIEAAVSSVRGSYVQVGGPTDPKFKISIGPVELLFGGIKIMGCTEGDSNPGVFIPQLIKYYREGKLPVDKMVKYYKATDFKEALHDMHSGATVKPVLVCVQMLVFVPGRHDLTLRFLELDYCSIDIFTLMFRADADADELFGYIKERQ